MKSQEIYIPECQICSETYNSTTNKPLSLTCGHTLCLDCVKQLLKGRNILCPSDRKNQSYESYETVAVNFALMGLMETKKKL